MATTAPKTDPAVEAWSLVFQLFFANKPRHVKIAQDFGLAPMQLHALRVLEPGQETSMSSLAEALVCDPSNVTGIVDRLEARGLIERRGAAHDRRVKMLAITEEGLRVRAAAHERMLEPAPQIAALSRADQRTLRDILRRALDA
jgi:DNA-binding MarR family transcriptional regulator